MAFLDIAPSRINRNPLQGGGPGRIQPTFLQNRTGGEAVLPNQPQVGGDGVAMGMGVKPAPAITKTTTTSTPIQQPAPRVTAPAGIVPGPQNITIPQTTIAGGDLGNGDISQLLKDRLKTLTVRPPVITPPPPPPETNGTGTPIYIPPPNYGGEGGDILPPPDTDGETQQPAFLEDLGTFIQWMLNNPDYLTRSTNPEDDQAYTSALATGTGLLDRRAEEERQRARVDAASRGLFYGTPLDFAQGKIHGDEQLALSQLESGLLGQHAQRDETANAQRQNWMSNLINQALNFGQQGSNFDLEQARLALEASRLGNQGAPDISAMLAALLGLPSAGGSGTNFGDIGSILAWLTSMQNNRGNS